MTFCVAPDDDDTADQTCQNVRNRIVLAGMQLADDGAHYLWAAQGQTPGDGSGLDFAPIVLDSQRLSQTTFNAAKLGNCTCVGRFRDPYINTLPPSPKVSSGSEQTLKDFVKNTSASSQANWGSQLTPRFITGDPVPAGVDPEKVDSAPIDYGGAGLLVNKLVWGEGCSGTQHFDCGGFIRYVVNRVCGGSVAGIKSIVYGNVPLNSCGKPMGRLLNNGEPITPGDILCYRDHIAFSLAGTQLTDTTSGSALPYATGGGGQYRVLQAESAVFGLNYDKSRKHDIGCIRLSRSTLLNSPTA